MPCFVFVDVTSIVEEYRNEDRAVFGTGPYEVRLEFQHFVVSENQLANSTQEERMSKVEKFVKCGMDGKRRLNQTKKRKSINQEFSVLSVTASSLGISTIPFSILQKMFGKANDLVRDSDEKVVAKPGATDGSYVVAGFGNTIPCVSPGKGGCLKCDRSCVNFSTKICAHTLAILMFAAL